MSIGTQLSDDEIHAWRSFLLAHRQLTKVLDRELVDAHGVSLPAYEVLLHLSRAPDRSARMSELAGRVLLSPSGITRLVDRLVGEGLIERTACSSDRRGVMAHLTDEGWKRFREAAPTHVRGVREHFVERLGPPNLDAVAEAMDQIVEPEPEA